VAWPPPDFLDESMRTFEHEVLMAYPASSLTSDQKFCGAFGHIQGEFLAIHPFREGNARTIKLVTKRFKQADYPWHTMLPMEGEIVILKPRKRQC